MVHGPHKSRQLARLGLQFKDPGLKRRNEHSQLKKQRIPSTVQWGKPS